MVSKFKALHVDIVDILKTAALEPKSFEEIIELLEKSEEEDVGTSANHQQVQTTTIQSQISRFFDQDFKKLRERCEREYNWNSIRSQRVLEAYKQFIELKAIKKDFAATELSPPSLVDQMWHAHILDTKEYYPACLRAFGQILHHDADGGLNLQARDTRRLEARTMAQGHFKQMHSDIWEVHLTEQQNSSNQIITIRARISASGDEEYIKMKKNQTFEALDKFYDSKFGSVHILHDGVRVRPKQTPSDLDMKEEESIDVVLEQQGC